MKRLISNYIDKKFYKLGWVKREENKYIIAYEKYIKKYNYTHHIDIIHKQSGNHLIQSYCDTETNNLFSYMVGLNFKEILLSILKMKLVF